jgi:hypothetical protein
VHLPVRDSLLATLTDETGQLDLGRSTGMSRSKDARLFVAALHSEAERTRSSTFDKGALKRIAESIGISSRDNRFDALLESVNWQGILLLRARGSYELQSSSFPAAPAARCVNNSQRGTQRGTQRNGSQQRQQPKQFRDDNNSADEYDN